MFGIAGNGDLYAFNNRGLPQPVFVDGQSFISTGVAGAVGLQFSTVDQNLWKLTTERGGEPGHSGANSFYFGEDAVTGIGRRYDFLGGAHGSIVTQPISLSGYSASDLPYLYFTYFLVTEEAAGRDAFRVFISDSSREDGRGQWHLLASNQQAELGTALDLDPEDDILIDVQQLFDNTWQDVPFAQDPNDPFRVNGLRDPFPYPDAEIHRPFDPLGRPWGTFDPPLNETQGVWRQARVNLGSFAGRSDLTLRFDFSTAASFDIGGAQTTGGAELLAVAGAVLRDGDTFVIDEETFEFDMGYTVVAAEGSAIADGESLRVSNGTVTVTFEFDRNGAVAGTNLPVAITDQSTAVEVADALAAALTAAGLNGVTVEQVDERLNLPGVQNITQSTGAVTLVEGAPGATGHPIVVHANMRPADVAKAMIQPLADVFAEGVATAIKSSGSVVRVIGHDVTDPGPLGLTAVLPGDALGSFAARTLHGKHACRIHVPAAGRIRRSGRGVQLQRHARGRLCRRPGRRFRLAR